MPFWGRWTPYLTRAVYFRSAVLALFIGAALTLINQARAIFGPDPFDILPLFLVFATPFIVVTASQVVAIRQAALDAKEYRLPAETDRLLALAITNGIPKRAISIGLMAGTANTTLILIGTLMHTGGMAAAPLALIGQVYVLPILFGVLSQTVSYRRAVNQIARQHR
ncbi:MAG: hypothetical protein ACTSW2_05205 [Alphaproteobacteria bacterium]